jgi:hypothetical protein
MFTKFQDTVRSQVSRTVSLWTINRPVIQRSPVEKTKLPDTSSLKDKISIAALLIRDRRFAQASSRSEQLAWQQAFDCLLVALQMLRQAELTPRHATHCIAQAQSLFIEASDIAAAYTAIIPFPDSQEWIG